MESITSSHRKQSIRVGQPHFTQAVAGVWQLLQEGRQALEVQRRQAATVRDQRPSLVPVSIEVQGVSFWALCDMQVDVSCHHANKERDWGSTVHPLWDVGL